MVRVASRVTSAAAKGYAGKNIVTKYILAKTDNTKYCLAISYTIFHNNVNTNDFRGRKMADRQKISLQQWERRRAKASGLTETRNLNMARSIYI